MPRLTTAYPLRAILAKAWCLARAGARRFGGAARSHLAAAMREVWAEEKAARAAIEGMKARVRASIATLPADVAACDRFMAAWHARQEAGRTVAARGAEVLAFRRPVPAAHPRRVAA